MGSFAIKPKVLIFNAAARFMGPELFPTKKLEFFKSQYLASKEVNAWLGLYEVVK